MGVELMQSTLLGPFATVDTCDREEMTYLGGLQPSRTADKGVGVPVTGQLAALGSPPNGGRR